MEAKVIAHRAANCVDAVRSATASGVHMIEADVHLFRGRLEVRHLKTLGPVRILWDRWRVANPFAPQLLFADMLEATAEHDAELVIDLKGRSRYVARHVREMIEPHLRAGRSFTICARAWHLLEEFEPQSGLRLVHSVGSARQLERLFRKMRGTAIDGISIHERILEPHVIERLRTDSRFVMTWPINTVERAIELHRAGIHGLISDEPETVLSALEHNAAQ
jgi:glycerophosphoryl diester phosphodiesterase